MYSLTKNSGFPVRIIYFTKNRVIGKEKSFSKNNFNSILENFKKNPTYKNEAKLKNNYYLNGREIKNNQLLEDLVKQNELQSSSIIREAELSLELEDLVYTGDSTYQSYQKIMKPKFNPFGLYIYTPKEGIIYTHIYPGKTITLFELNKINEGSAFCNSYNDLYISGSNESNNKNFWIINNNNYEIKKKNMPTNKKNHSMIFLNFNKNDEWIFIVGGNDKKTFYYDLNKNYFINWGDTNEIYTKPAIIQLGEYLYIFDSINYRKNFIERTKIINPDRKWEKLNINIDKRKINYFPSKFGLSYDSDGKILLLGGENNKINNTLVYEPSNNNFILSQNGTNDDVDLDDKTFYKINNKYSVSLPHNLNEVKEICAVDKDDQSLIKINIECPKDNNKTKVMSNLSLYEKPSFINDKSNITIKTTKIEINENENENDLIEPSSYKSYNKQKPYASNAPYNQPDNNPLLCDNCLYKNKGAFICPCCHNPFQRNTFNNNNNNLDMNYNDNNNYNSRSNNVDNPTRENPRITVIEDEYFPLGSMNFQSGNNNYRKVYNKNYNRARDKAKVEIIYDEYTPIKVDYELNKQPGSIKKYTYKYTAKKVEPEKKNEEDNINKNKNEDVKNNEQQNDEAKKDEDKQDKDDKNEKDNKDIENNENNENDVVEYKNNEPENKDDDLFTKSQNEEEEHQNENENENEIIIEENHNNEDGEGLQENNVDGEDKEKLIEIDEEDNKEKNENVDIEHIENNDNNENINNEEENKEGNNINGELPKDNLEIKDVVKDENNNNNEINKETGDNKDNIVIKDGEEFHSMEEDNGDEHKNSVEHIDNNDNDNDNNMGVYENGNEIKFDGDNNEEDNGEHNDNDNDNGNAIEGDDGYKLVQTVGVESEEMEGEEEAMVFEEGEDEEMNYNYEEGEGEEGEGVGEEGEGEGEGEGQEGMNNEGGEEEMNYDGDFEEGGGSMVENDLGNENENENEEQNSVIEINHDENENENGEGEGQGEEGEEGHN